MKSTTLSKPDVVNFSRWRKEGRVRKGKGTAVSEGEMSSERMASGIEHGIGVRDKAQESSDPGLRLHKDYLG